MRDRLIVAWILMSVAAGCGPSRERERVDFERMRLQQRYDLFSASSVFPNREAMQAPPAGTMSRETIPDTGGIGAGTLGGKAVTSIPIALTAEERATGAKLFRIYCAVCHGPAGYGGSTVAENMGPPRPPSLRSARLMALPVGYIFVVATHGIGRMPSYASQLTPTERWAIVAYVKQLQTTASTTREAIDDSLRAIGIQRADSMVAAGRKS
jgi:mono/diheme cytochrome c family protein